MKKKWTGLLVLAMTAAVLGGCGGEKGVGSYVKPGDYSNLEVNMETIGVDEADVIELMNDLYISCVTKEHGGITDRAVRNGDVVDIDYEGKKDGVAFQGGTDKGASLGIGTGQFIPGFEEGLIGVMPGETVDLDLTFPEAYDNAELAGQAVVFTVTVNFIQPESVAEEDMEDEVIVSIGIPNVTTKEQLRKYSYDLLYSQYEAELQSKIVDIMIERSNFKKYPSKLLDPYVQEVTNNVNLIASYYRVSADIFIRYRYNESSEEYIKRNAERALKEEMLVQAIAKKESMTVGDDELQEWLQYEAEKLGFSSVDEYVGENSLDKYRDACLKEKVLRYLMDNTTVKEGN